MSKKTVSISLTVAQKADVKSVINTLDALSKSCLAWEATLYQKANDALYALLADCLHLYNDKFVQVDADVRKELRKELIEKLRKDGVRTQKNSSTLTLIVRYVFKSDRRRAHSYSTALIAALSAKVNPNCFAQWVANAGGLEEIKRQAKESDEAKAKKRTLDTEIESVKNDIEYRKTRPHETVGIPNMKATPRAVLLCEPGPNGEFRIVAVVPEVSNAMYESLIKAAAKHNIVTTEETNFVNTEVAPFIQPAVFASNDDQRIAA